MGAEVDVTLTSDGGGPRQQNVERAPKSWAARARAWIAAEMARLAIWLLGYDVFISYASDDRSAYAARLSHCLRGARTPDGPTLKPRLVFHAQSNAERLVGRALKPSLAGAVRHSSVVVLLDSPLARQREYVGLEVADARRAGKDVIRIVERKAGAEAWPAWDGLIALSNEINGLTGIDEDAVNLRTGTPSKATLSLLGRALVERRKLQVFAWITGAAAAVVAVLITALVVIARDRSANQLAINISDDIDHARAFSRDALTSLALHAVAVSHTAVTDTAYRKATALSLSHRLQLRTAAAAVSARAARIVRVTSTGVESSSDPWSDTSWTKIIDGHFDVAAVSDAGDVVVAGGKGAVVVRVNGAITQCATDAGAAVAVAASGDGRRIAALVRDGERFRLLVWDTAVCSTGPVHTADVETAGTPPTVATPNESPRLNFNRPGTAIVASLKQAWNLWAVTDTALRRLTESIVASARDDAVEIESGDDVVVNAEAFSDDGKYAAVAATAWIHGVPVQGQSPRVLVVPMTQATSPKPIGSTRGAGLLVFSADGRRVVAASGRVTVFDVDTGREVTHSGPLRSAATGVALAADDSVVVVATGGVQPGVSAVDATSGVLLDQIDTDASSDLRAGFPRGTSVLMRSKNPDADYALLRVAGRAPAYRLPINGEINIAIAIPDADHVVFSGQSHLLRLGSARDGVTHHVELGADKATRVAAEGTAVAVLLESPDAAHPDVPRTATVRCTIGAALDCSPAAPAVRASAIALTPDGRLRVATEPMKLLALSASAAIRVHKGDTACVAPSDGEDSCDSLPLEPMQSITAAAISADGAVAAIALAREHGSRIQLYRRSWTQYFPLPRRVYALFAAFDQPGEVGALRFSADANCVTVAADWNNNAIVVEHVDVVPGAGCAARTASPPVAPVR